MTARRPRVAWFTGLSGAGKSTIAGLVEQRLTARGLRVAVLDGDVVRARYATPLGFSPDDIRENNRRIAELCLEALPTTDVILVPVISPFRDARDAARARIGDAFVEVYVAASPAQVQARDPKGLYADAAAGRRAPLIGFRADLPYEAPLRPEVVLDTERASAEALADQLIDRLLTGTPTDGVDSKD